MGAAIPQALLLLHVLMDILPYPKGEKGMWYEITTGSVECVDEVGKGGGSVAAPRGTKAPTGDRIMEKDQDVDLAGIDIADIGGMEEDEPDRKIRIKVSNR